MTIMLVVLIGGVVFLAVIGLIIAAVVGGAKRAARQVVHTASSRVLDRALDLGEEGIRAGAKELGKVISKEMTVNDPKKMATAITKIARRNKGELTVMQIMAEMDIEERIAEKALERLVSEEMCFKESREDHDYYIFPGFKKKKTIKKCEYCDSAFDVDEAEGSECPSCGATLTLETILV